MSTSILSKNN